jgi:hypothetical protein
VVELAAVVLPHSSIVPARWIEIKLVTISSVATSIEDHESQKRPFLRHLLESRLSTSV